MAKLTDDQLRFIIDLDAKGAQGEINSLETEMSKLEAKNSKLKKSLQDVNAVLTKQEKQLKKMEEAGLQYTEAYKNLSASIEQNKKKQSEWKEELVRNQNIYAGGAQANLLVSFIR